MKLAVSNLKNLDYKQFGINHGEKLAIAIVGLLLLLVLWSTKWKQPVTESPDQLIAEATTAEETIKKQPWPPAEAAALKTGTDLDGRATSYLSPLELSPWVLPVPLNKSYHPERALITRPKWLAVKDLIADAQAVDLEMDPKIEPLKEGFKKLKEKDAVKQIKKSDAPKEEEKPEEIPDELKRTNGSVADSGGGFNPFGRGRGGRGMMMGGEGGFGRGVGAGRDPSVPNSGRRGSRRKKNAPPDSDTATASVSPPGQKKAPKLVGRGYHAIIVRGVFPLREQVTELVRAMGNAVSRRDAQDLVQMHDFKLERQTAKPGPDPWSGPWEPVDREAVLEMFQHDIFNFAAESVQFGIVDSHICMPLPVRMIGEWGRMASHPAVNDFRLSPDEIQAQLDYEHKLIEKLKAEEKIKIDKKDKGGFTEFTQNLRKARRQSQTPELENTKSIQEQIVEDLMKSAKERPSEAEINAKLIDYIKKQATPQDHLLLFRYADFFVEPGKIYRYRVKLVVDNPFLHRHAEEVADPSLLDGPYRETEYSEPTRPVFVPNDARFFVAHVDGRPGRPSLPSADVDLYQWFASTGTVVNRALHTQIGQLVGGLKTASVLRLEKNGLEQEWVPFSTNDALLDVATGFSLDPGLHRDLLVEVTASEDKKKSPGDKERRATGTMVPDELVIVDDNGAVQLIDALDQQPDHLQAKRRYKFQNEQWVPADTGDSKDKKRLDRGSKRPAPRRPGKGSGKAPPGGES